VSLHASNQKLREKLMPIVAKDNTLDELFYVLDKYVNKRNKRVTYEYIL
jgi:adenine C2-methylase RlmN of 23S rRNA A2503 and tRNA A37